MKYVCSEVKNYYSSHVDQEWERLFKNALNRREYDTTWRFPDHYLPPDGLLLAAGGRPGLYPVGAEKSRTWT